MSNSRLFSFACIGICLISLAGMAQAGTITPTIDVRAAISPDPFSADSYFYWNGNALSALRTNSTTYGSPNDPAYYQQVQWFWGYQVIGTDFNSWLGEPNPAYPYDNEFGNMLEFPVAIYGNGLKFTLGDVSFTNTFYGKNESPLQVSSVGWGEARMIGINYGADGAPGGIGANKDIMYSTANPGTSSTTFDVLYFTGFGVQFYVPDESGLADAKAKIANAISPYGIGTYTLSVGGQNYSDTMYLTPEPGTLALAGSGLLLALAALRRRRSRSC